MEAGILKIDFGVHIDGYPVVLAHSLVLGERTEEHNKLMSAAYQGLVTGVKMLKVGESN